MSDVQRPSGASSQCPHSDLHFHLNNVGMSDTNLHYLEVTAHCKICDKPMVWRGVPIGSSPDHPAASGDGRELRLPFLGDGEDMTGKPMGFTVSRVV